jgi:hypothetical protein
MQSVMGGPPLYQPALSDVRILMVGEGKTMDIATFSKKIIFCISIVFFVACQISIHNLAFQMESERHR